MQRALLTSPAYLLYNLQLVCRQIYMTHLCPDGPGYSQGLLLPHENFVDCILDLQECSQVQHKPDCCLGPFLLTSRRLRVQVPK